MNNASLELGGTNWAEKDGNILGYSVGDTSGKYSPQEFTFARGSNLSATRIDRAGLIVKGRENLALYSQDFNNAAWLKSGILVNSNTEANPIDGNVDADTITASAGTTQKYIGVSNSVNGLFTYSFYAKYISQQFVQMFVGADAGFVANFDLQNGNQSASGCTATIVSAGNGWYRCSVFFTSTIGSGVYISPVDSLSSPRFSTTSSTNSFYLFGAQLETSLVDTPYIESGATNGTAGVLENTPRLNYTTGVANPYLLLEPSRTNIVPYSEYFETSEWTTPNVVFETNKAISPDGGFNATKFRANSANSTHWASTALTLTSGQDYTFKLYVKSAEYDWVQISLFGTGWVGSTKTITFNASTGEFGTTDTGITFDSNPMGNGWHEVIITNEAASTSGIIRVYPMPSDNATSYQGDGTSGVYIFGAMLEQGSYATSYIPTYSVSATRAVDVCNKTNASGEIGQTEGTLYADFEIPENGAANYPAILNLRYSVSPTANRFGFLRNPTGGVHIYMITNGSSQWTVDTTQTSGRLKIALGYQQNNIAVYVNGVLLYTTTSSLIPLTDILSINSLGFGNLETKSNINQILLYKERLTNAELATLTTI